jgi:hypothetical protein
MRKFTISIDSLYRNARAVKNVVMRRTPEERGRRSDAAGPATEEPGQKRVAKPGCTYYFLASLH